MRILKIVSTLLALMLVALIGCSENPSGTDNQTTGIQLDLNLTSSDMADQITSFRVVVTGSDMDSVIAPLYLEGSYLVGEVDVPMGLNRKFHIQAFDELGNLIYEGITYSPVPTLNGAIAIDLQPQVEMSRLIPRAVTVGPQSQVTFSLRVNKLDSLYGISGRVYWDSDVMQIDSAFASSDDPTLLFFSHSDFNGDTLAFSLTESDQTTLIVDDSGDGTLVTFIVSTNTPVSDLEVAHLSVDITGGTYSNGDTMTTAQLDQIEVEGAIIEVSSSTSATVVFPDPNLEAVVRTAIAKPTGPILVSDVNQLQTLVANFQGIRDLTGIQHMTELKVLSLIDNEITNLQPLSGLTQLFSLLLGRNQIVDISPLSGLTGLGGLEMNENLITDVSPLGSLTFLAALVISSNDIRDISPLQTLVSLQVLDLDDNNIIDISALTSLIALTDLELVNNSIVDITPLVNNIGLGTGDEVFLTGNPLSSTSSQELIPILEARGVTVEF